MSTIISILSDKTGTNKTTTALKLAETITEATQKTGYPKTVTIIDLNPNNPNITLKSPNTPTHLNNFPFPEPLNKNATPEETIKHYREVIAASSNHDIIIINHESGLNPLTTALLPIHNKILIVVNAQNPNLNNIKKLYTQITKTIPKTNIGFVLTQTTKENKQTISNQLKLINNAPPLGNIPETTKNQTEAYYKLATNCLT